jgi:hypothetical protein
MNRGRPNWLGSRTMTLLAKKPFGGISSVANTLHLKDSPAGQRTVPCPRSLGFGERFS